MRGGAYICLDILDFGDVVALPNPWHFALPGFRIKQSNPMHFYHIEHIKHVKHIAVLSSSLQVNSARGKHWGKHY